MKKFNKKISEQILELIRTDTYTVAEICNMVHISKATFYNWQKVDSDFADKVKEAREELRQVIVCEAKKSLLKQIKGYTLTETRVIRTPTKEVNEDGRQILKTKMQITTEKHVPPSTQAIIFFLTNNEPTYWKNRKENMVLVKHGSCNSDNACVLSIKQMKDLELDTKIEGLEKKFEKKK